MSQVTPDLARPAKPSETFLPVSGGRKAKNSVATAVFTLSFIVAVIPLIALLYKVVSAGAEAIINPNWWTNSLFLVSPRLAESAAPAAFCCAFDFAGMAFAP